MPRLLCPNIPTSQNLGWDSVQLLASTPRIFGHDFNGSINGGHVDGPKAQGVQVLFVVVVFPRVSPADVASESKHIFFLNTTRVLQGDIYDILIFHISDSPQLLPVGERDHLIALEPRNHR